MDQPDNSFLEVPGPYEGYDMDALKTDEAYLTVTSYASPQTLYLYGLSYDCTKCPYTPISGDLSSSAINTNGTTFTISTKRPWSLFVTDLMGEYFDPTINSSYQISCDLKDVSFGEFGIYNLDVDAGQCQEMQTLKQPVFIYGGMIIAVFVYLAIFGIANVVPCIINKFKQTGLGICCRTPETQTEIDMNKGEDDSKAQRKRIKSLDTFRGMTIVLMIFVNYGAGQYWFMGHATWDGLLVADLVFPWFMWIMGVCIPMGIRSSIKRKVPKLTTLKRIFIRSLKLFMLGIILNSLGGWNTLAKYRVPGVLQRFAICYLVCATVMLFMPEVEVKESKMHRKFADVISAAGQWVFYLAFIAIHIGIMYGLPVPGCPTGYIGPGGIDLLYSEGESKPDCIGGATGYIDRWLVGVDHLYQNPTAKHVYKSGAFDPEGVLGSMLSVFQVFLGMVAGNILHHYKEDKERLSRWAAWGLICGVIGAIFCYCGAADAPMPLNKNLWSLSYVMVTSCFAFFLLAFFYYVVDTVQIWSGGPLYQAGMNSIFLYCGHMVAYNLFPWHYAIGPMRSHASLLAECLWGTTLWVIIALYLHHKKKFYAV